MNRDTHIGVLFVCLGNICRSPMAEGVFLHKLHERNLVDQFQVDSAGTGGWHVGERADGRARAIADQHGIDLPSRARKVLQSDATHFQYIIAMDEQNREDLLTIGIPEQQLSLLLEYDKSNHLIEVPDPYYGGTDGFETIYQLINVACDELLTVIMAHNT